MTEDKSKYAVLNWPGALGFKSISIELDKNGYKLTPARVRILLLQSLEKITRSIIKTRGTWISKEKAKEICMSPEFQQTIAPVIQMAYYQEEV